MEIMTGTFSEYKPKKESKVLFEPMTNITNINGMPVFIDRVQDRYESALSDKKQEIYFNLCRSAKASSFFEPNRNILDKFYNSQRFDVLKKIKVSSDTLDNQLKINKIFDAFHNMLTNNSNDSLDSNDELGDLAVMSGVSQFPTRVKCATLSWHALRAALSDDKETVKTE